MNNKYIKKSVEIEAIQWNGNNVEEIMKFLNSEFSYERNTEYVTKKFSYYQTTNNLYIKTLEGEMKANIGDYIIKGIKGEYYPCKPDIFELTYEKVYSLEEVKQMWEELGYKWFDRKKENYVELRNEEKEEIIIIDYEKKRYAKSDTRVKWVLCITYQEHDLIIKTIKTLEKEKENVCS